MASKSKIDDGWKSIPEFDLDSWKELEKIGSNVRLMYVKILHTEKHEKMLAYIAENEKSPDVCAAAIKKLPNNGNVNLLISIVESGKRPNLVRVVAIDKLLEITNKRLNENPPNPAVLKVQIKKLEKLKDELGGKSIKTALLTLKKVGADKSKTPEEKKEDHQVYNKAYYAANKEALQAHNKTYRAAYLEKIREQEKTYREKNKAAIQAYEKAYRESHKVEQQEYAKEYYETNKEVIKEKKKEYYEANREKIKESRRKFSEENKEMIREKRRKYREKKKAQESEQWGTSPKNVPIR
jgi:hypothetical protein